MIDLSAATQQLVQLSTRPGTPFADHQQSLHAQICCQHLRLPHTRALLSRVMHALGCRG